MSSNRAESGSAVILSEIEFRSAIKLERSRSDRSGARFCLVVFGVGRERSALEAALRARTRIVDIVGRFGRNEVAVLLPKTDAQGAHRVASDIVRRMNGSGGSILFRVLAYPASDAGIRAEEETTFSPLVDELQPVCAVPMPLWKRSMDIVGAALGLIALVPVFLLLSAYIEIVSPGPVIFKQKRVGYRGKLFTCLKLRTMRPGSDASGHRSYLKSLIAQDNPMTKLDHCDPRLIPGAAVIRKLALDELPQLVNVLRGEMSLVGPRPCIPYEAGEFLRWHTRRFDVVPGLTGLWQVRGKNRLSFKEMIRLDNKYARNLSFWLDVRILAMTLPAIALMAGAAIFARLRNRPQRTGN